MDFITFCPDVMNMRVWRSCDRYFHRKSRKKQKNKIRPANAIFDGVMKPSVRGAVKNHNPRKGTETSSGKFDRSYFEKALLRTTIPARGLKLRAP